MDADNPMFRAHVAYGLRFVARQVLAAADDLEASRMTPWQFYQLAERVNRLITDVGFLTKDVKRLKPLGDDE
jgi:hypothetical protein